MSRSARKAWVVDGYGSQIKKYQKNQANRRIRRAKEVPDGNSYRRYFNPYDICDYKFFVNVTHKDDPSYEENYWRVISK